MSRWKEHKDWALPLVAAGLVCLLLRFVFFSDMCLPAPWSRS